MVAELPDLPCLNGASSLLCQFIHSCSLLLDLARVQTLRSDYWETMVVTTRNAREVEGLPSEQQASASTLTELEYRCQLLSASSELSVGNLGCLY